MRRKLAYLLFGLSSLCKALGKLVINKEQTIVVDALTLPGWFVLDECIIHQINIGRKGFPGFEWHWWSMPDEWCKEMRRLKHRK
jgi:hypothetical protein